MMVKTSLYATLLCAVAFSPSAVGAKASSPFAAKVTASVRSMEEAADDAFVKTWTEVGEQGASAGVTATQVRSATRWIIAGYSLGICAASNTDIAAWLSKFDTLPLGDSEANAARAKLHQIGMESLNEGKVGTELSDLTAAERSRLCAVELEAARLVIRKL